MMLLAWFNVNSSDSHTRTSTDWILPSEVDLRFEEKSISFNLRLWHICDSFFRTIRQSNYKNLSVYTRSDNRTKRTRFILLCKGHSLAKGSAKSHLRHRKPELPYLTCFALFKAFPSGSLGEAGCFEQKKSFDDRISNDKRTTRKFYFSFIIEPERKKCSAFWPRVSAFHSIASFLWDPTESCPHPRFLNAIPCFAFRENDVIRILPKRNYSNLGSYKCRYFN